LATDFERVLADPVAWCDAVVRFLGDVGVTVDPGRLPAAGAFVKSDLRHQRGASEPAPGPATGARLVFAELCRRQGAHPEWEPPDLGPEPEWVDEVLTMARDLETLHIAYASLQRSRGVRLVTGLWKLRTAASRRSPGQRPPG
jgi:hypothetical protein